MTADSPFSFLMPEFSPSLISFARVKYNTKHNELYRNRHTEKICGNIRIHSHLQKTKYNTDIQYNSDFIPFEIS
jgi:hypothetical protein